MIALDAFILAAYTILFGYLKTRDSFAIILAFSASCLYTASGLFTNQEPWINHLVVSFCFIPAFYFLTKPVFFGVLTYSIYHWVVSADYILYPSMPTLVSGTFTSMILFINVYIMLAIIYASKSRIYSTDVNLGSGWLADIQSRKRQAGEVQK